LAQRLPNVGFSNAAPSTELPQAFTGTVTGTCTVLPEAMPGEPSVPPLAPESASAGLPYMDRMLVAAAAAAIPLPRVCRTSRRLSCSMGPARWVLLERERPALAP
jgi:hypothetical protein